MRQSRPDSPDLQAEVDELRTRLEVVERLLRITPPPQVQATLSAPPPPAEVPVFFPPTAPVRHQGYRTGIVNGDRAGFYQVGASYYAAGRMSEPLSPAQVEELEGAGFGDRIALLPVGSSGQPVDAAAQEAWRQIERAALARETGLEAEAARARAVDEAYASAGREPPGPGED